ncbi:hypothetical protein NX059_008858 [Plenodomus lindquistii]|nr:hypothetical protein NX059_008858 [Plenodomus lindquistii]
MAPPKLKEPRARRTIKACVICHKKKVRCDIDEIEGEVCTPCQRDGYECVPRERKRKRFTLSPSPPRRVITPSMDSPVPEHSRAADSGSDPRDLSRDRVNDTSLAQGSTLKPNHQQVRPKSDSRRGRMSSVPSVQEASPHVKQRHQPECPTPHRSTSTSRTDSTPGPSNRVSWLGRLEYLQTDVPVDDDTVLPGKTPLRLSESDIEILRVQRVLDLPPRAVRDSLMDAFWTRCYPWSPVVDRSWFQDRDLNQVSLLLQHAMLLAGSRVSAPNASYPPEEFYKKARVLFWVGAEKDPMIVLAATCLMHWWNPDGPEHISLDTSSFWLRVCVGLAYQVGLHREPTGKVDAALRRRIWWTLVVRDSLINAGHGRPRAIDLKQADVSLTSTLDFDGIHSQSTLFTAYVGISCILGDLTQSYLRKHGLQEQKGSLEDRLYRWLKTLPGSLQLCKFSEGRPLAPYNFESRQIHVQYFTVLTILNRPTESTNTLTTASVLASSYVAGIFEDFLARDEIRYLGPIFTFYCLTAGLALLSAFQYTELQSVVDDNLAILLQALEELSKRWPSAVGSLKHLENVRQKLSQRPRLTQLPGISLSDSTSQFFSDFGPDLCRLWQAMYQKQSQKSVAASGELEMAGILQGPRRPINQHLDLDVATINAAGQVMSDGQPDMSTSLEPSMLQPQEFLGLYGGSAWLAIDWDQAMGW